MTQVKHIIIKNTSADLYIHISLHSVRERDLLPWVCQRLTSVRAWLVSKGGFALYLTLSLSLSLSVFHRCPIISREITLILRSPPIMFLSK